MKDINPRVKKKKKNQTKKKWLKSLIGKKTWLVFSEHVCGCALVICILLWASSTSPAPLQPRVADRVGLDPPLSVCRSWSLRQLCGERDGYRPPAVSYSGVLQTAAGGVFVPTACPARDLQLADTFVHSAASCDILWLWDDIVIHNLVSGEEWFAVP